MLCGEDVQVPVQMQSLGRDTSEKGYQVVRGPRCALPVRKGDGIVQQVPPVGTDELGDEEEADLPVREGPENSVLLEEHTERVGYRHRMLRNTGEVS
ncbi:hypothetical protein SDC9_203450 [bioreactor metagenome]|uniref:Uncharacterized protein n=1 Tax=bioreactor metagenome TaxID=1076179 RepID=A0A645IX71_9ZZZZ